MLEYVSEENILHRNARIALHYIVKSSEDALFLETISRLKRRHLHAFTAHLWITRQVKALETSSSLSDYVFAHQQEAVSEEKIGQPWSWFDSFEISATDGISTREERDVSLVYICGPQGLTDRLVDIYKDRGLDLIAGHVQIEKWW